MGIRVMVVDDEPEVRALFVDVLERHGHTVHALADGQSALELAAREPIDLAFLDIKMPGLSGVETLSRLRVLQPQATCVMVTGYADNHLVDQCMALGAEICMCKPIGMRELLDMVEMAAGSAAEPAGAEG